MPSTPPLAVLYRVIACPPNMGAQVPAVDGTRARRYRSLRRVQAVCAGQLAESAQRAAGLTLVALEAARADTDIAAVAGQLMAQRQIMAAWMVDGLLRWEPLRAGQAVTAGATARVLL